MKIATYLSAVALLLVGIGCNRTEVDAPDFQSAWTIESEKVVDLNYALVEKFTIHFQGARSISNGPSERGFQVTPSSPDGNCTAEVLLMAMVDPGSNDFTCFITVYQTENGKKVSGGGGSPRTVKIKLEELKNNELIISRIISINKQTGSRNYGETITLGTFLTEVPHAEPLTLTVK